MAKDFKPVQRDQVFLLPPDMREWLPPGHLVFLTIRIVDGLDLTEFQRRAKLGGRGRAPVDPAMLVTLLVYGYASGVRSSRQIERLCHTDVAFRVVCGNEPPDHTVIARFRQRHDAAFVELFEQVLAVCVKAGMGRFATIAIDGTKVAANASSAMTRSEDSIRKRLRAVMDEAAAADAAEDELFGDRRGDELPPELRDPTTVGARLKAAIAEVEAEKAAEAVDNAEQARVAHWHERAAASQARYDQALRAAHASVRRRVASGNSGRYPLVPAEDYASVRREAKRLATTCQRRDEALAKAAAAPTRRRATHANTTDPQSRLMRTRKGFVQGFNTQLAVTDDHLTVTNAVTDTDQLHPMISQVQQRLTRLRKATGQRGIRLGTVLADAGYASEANLTAAGPRRLIAVRDNTGPPGSATAAMRERLAEPRNNKRYRRRAALVEPVNGHLKDRIGLRQFSRRGLTATNAEAHLAAAALNLRRLHRVQPA